ncbi:biliverdin-producing heme oxygenase [Luteimonas sp. MC1828]|uniref:biliverdin-producing heme oxygenase n=1 Tax=Luteimonas sp. MC1828 TaxID=2799787 RepID=UPI0018F15916|nr:biliverdin-producing heme oxygenase [Luteimonas sp. MC1828]MBJ7573807.1 biliverdin-producing heme oxygenase [Luteimonas sp. MC1828]
MGADETRHAGALHEVRAATRATHEALDAALPDGLHGVDDYTRYLGALLPLAQWLADSWSPAWPEELACWYDSERVDCLRADLAALDAPASGSAMASAATPAEWLGGCYVMEGSALGARVLSRHVDALVNERPEVADARQFMRHLGRDPKRWRCFAGRLDALPADAVADAVRGARRGFAMVYRNLVPHGVPA